MADLRLNIQANTRQPQQQIDALRREITQLRTQTNQTQQSSTAAGRAIDAMGDEARQAATGVTALGRSIFNTSAEAKRFDGVFRSTNGRLREANGRYVKGREAVEGLGRSFGGATGGAQVFTRSLGSLGGVLGGLGLVAASAGVLRVGANSVEASVKVEGFRNSLTALYGDAQVANTVLARLQELSLLPGITFESAVQGAVRLKTVGVEGERAEGVIREFGNAAALAGATTDEVGRSLVGLTQILSRGKISQEELNQILENLPLIGNSIRESFGSIDAEVIRDQLDAAGQSVQDFADILVNQLSMGARASADSTRNAFSNLENATFRLHAAIGDRLSPSVREATGFLTDLANTAADFVAGTNDATRSANSYADALMMASNAAAVNSAIQERIKFLEQERAGLEAAAAGSANYFEIRGRERDAGRQYREAGEELDVLRTALGNTAAATEHFQGVQNELLETQQGITQEIIRLEAQRAGETGRAYGQTTRRIREQREALAETQEEIGENAVVLRALASANTVVTAATDDTTAATKESTAATKEATVEIITYAEAIRQVQANIEAYVEEQAVLTDFGTFWEIAAGQADGYTTAIDLTTVSVVNLKNELDALTTLFNENNVVINENGVVLDEETQALLRFLATLDGLDESLANVESRLYAHNAALVNPAVSEAVESFRDYNDVLSETGVNFERVDSISDRLTSSIRQGSSAFDEFSRSVEKGDERLQEFFDLITNRGNRAIDEFNENVIDTTRTYIPGLNRSINLTSGEIAALRKAAEDATPDFLFKAIDDLDAITLDNLIGEFSRLDGVVGDLGTKIGQFDLAGLATGNPLSIATLPFQLYDAFTFDQRQAEARLPELNRQNQASFERGEFGIPPDLLEFGRGQLDRATLATGTSGFGGRPLLDLLEGLEPQIGRTSLDAVANLPERIRETIQTFTDQITNELTNELSQASFNLNFAGQTGGDVEGALQDVIGANTALYQAQIDSYNLQRQALGYAVGNVDELNRILNGLNNQSRLAFADLTGPQNAQQFLAANNITRGLTPGQDDQERGLTSAEVARVDDEVLAAALQANQEAIAAINVAIAELDNAISQSNDPAEIEQLLQQIAIQIPERYRLRREALQQQLDAGDITQGAFDTSIAQLGIEESAEVERNSDAMLANALLINRQAIEAINVQVAGLEQAITTSNDPAEIESLLLQIAQQIPEIYRLRREALSQQFAAGEITLQSFNTSIAQLNIEQSSALEQNSDQRLANTLLINQQQTEAVSSAISELENRIAQSNDPAEIAQLLMQIAEQIPEIYRLRRNALSAQFAAGEITLSAINTGIAALNIEESAALERNSDAILTNALRANQDAQTAIHTEISALEQAITTSNDPAEIAMLLMQIAEQIPEKYRLKREALQAQFDANEITIEQLQNGLAALDIEQAAEFERNSDAILANALSDHNADVVIISNAIHSVSEEIRNSDDPARIVQLVESLSQIIMEKFRLRREFLQKRLDAEEITVKEYQGQLGRLDIQESDEIGAVETLGESRIETITRPAPSVSQRSTRRGGGGTDPAQAAQRAADEALANALRANQDAQDTISVEVSALENAISESNDPTEITGLLMQIAEQIPETYRLRREALQTQFDASKITQGQLDNGLAALDIEQSAMIERNSDAQLANALRINSEAAAAISADVSDLENQIAQSNDLAEIAALLQQIAAQIPETYRLRREALQKQYDAGEITLSALNTGLSQLNIEQSAALEQNSDAMLANALSMNQQAAEAINTHIAGLEERISSSNDPVEIATLLQQVAQQIPEIYRLRREALQRQFDAGEITLQALETGLAQANIDESAALEQNSDAQLANTLSVLSTNAQVVNNSITSLSEQIRNSTDPAEIATLVVDLQNAVMEKYRLQREVFQKQLDAEEITIGDFKAQLGSINLSETSELTSAAALGGAETDDLRRTSNALLQNALQRAQENLTGATSEEDFETRRQELLRFIEEYYDAEKARIDALMLSESQLRDQQEDTEFARQRALQQATTATNRFAEDRIRTEEQVAEERLRTEQRLSDEIEGIRDDQLENEADRQQSLQDLAEDHQDRLTDIERDGLRRREDLQRELSRDFADNFREEQEQIAELLSGEGFDTREIRRFLQGFEGDVRGRLGEDALSQLNEIQREGAVESIDLRRERDRDLEDIGIREGRQVEDAERRFTASQEDIHAQAQATADALTTALEPLLGMQATLTQQQQDTAVLENVTATNTAATAATQVQTAMKEETNAAMTAATARVESNTAARRSAIAAMEARLQEQTATNIERFGVEIERFGEIPDLFSEVGERLTMSADRLDFSAAALTQSAELWATALGRDLELLAPAERPDFAAQDAVSLQPDIDAELAMAFTREAVALSADIVNINANSVNLNADIAGGVSSPQTPTRPVEVTIQHNQPVQIDGQTLGRIVDEVLVRLDTNGGTVGSYVRRDT